MADLVHSHFHIGPAGDLHQPIHLAASHNLVGDQDVSNAVFGQDLRLAQFGARYSYCGAGCELSQRERCTFVILEVWAKLGFAAVEEVRHLANVAIRRRPVQ